MGNRKNETVYTYYLIEFKDCLPEAGDFAVCENLTQVKNRLKFVDADLDDPYKEAEVKIIGVALTPRQYKAYQTNILGYNDIIELNQKYKELSH